MEPTKGFERGRGAFLDYGTRKVPDDQFNGLNIGYRWRKHWSILCFECSTPSPYVMGLRSEEEKNHNGTLVTDYWTLKCPKCGNQWVNEDQYYED